MPLSREAHQVSQDIKEAADIYRERKISTVVDVPGALDPVALTIQIARLIGEERRGSKPGASRINVGTDPVSVARRSPRVPFAPTPEPSTETKSKRSHKKKEVRTPVAPKATEAEPKARKRSSR